MKKKGLVGVAAAAAVGLTLLFSLGNAEPRPHSRTASPRPWSGMSPLVLAAEHGIRRRYRVEHRTLAKTDIAGAVAESAIDIAGEMTLRIYEDGPSPLHGVRFRPLRVSGCESLQAELETETLIRRDAEGRAVALRFSKRTSAMARNVLRALLAALEVVIPATIEEKWAEPGIDTTGRFVAEYAVLSRSAEGTRISRRKRYEELHVANGPKFEVTTGGKTEILIDRTGALARLHGDESLELRAGPIRISSASETRFAFLSPEPDDSPLVDECGKDTGFAPEGMAVGRPPVPAASMDRTLTVLSAVVGRDSWRQEAPKSFLTLKALFEDSEDARAQAKALLRSGVYPPDILQLVADALGSIPEGAPILLDLARSGSIFAVHALGLTPQLDDAIVSGLASLVRSPGEIADAAIVSLGFAAGIPSNEAKRDAVARELVPLLGDSAERDVQVLQALGNAASPRSLEAVLARIASTDPEIRATVAVALRNVRGPAALEGIARLASDESVLVRRQAVMVLAVRPEPEARGLLEQAARSDPHEVVRAQARLSLQSN